MSDTTSEDAKEAMQFVHCIFSALFVCGLLFVVLCMLAEMRSRKSHEVSWQLFYIPKAVLMLAMWVTMLGGYISVIASDQGHLTFDGPGDQDQHYVALVLLCIEIAVYLIWVLIAALGAMYSMLSYFPARQFLFVFFVLLTTIVTALGTLISYYFTVSTLQFVMLFGTCNLFVWTLAVCFCPVYVTDKTSVSGDRYFHDASEEELWKMNVALPDMSALSEMSVSPDELEESQIKYDDPHSPRVEAVARREIMSADDPDERSLL
eukprot:TRINITY_DN6791_c0_g1_i1.p1 TRINITY_DN6791_c0_g1~~TRINITY_DN6791_c0_g1_i1.p1  ORF type:complete len:263 (-),score=56.34 TRINITY_DN6791_c0_g1_i1:275-1063(-)